MSVYKFKSGQLITQGCTRFLEAIQPLFRLQLLIDSGPEWQDMLFPNQQLGVLKNQILGKGAHGVVTASPVLLNHVPIAVKYQRYNWQTVPRDANECQGWPQRMQCSEFLQETLSCALAGHLLRMGDNPGLLNYFGSFVGGLQGHQFIDGLDPRLWPQKTQPVGALVMERAATTMNDILSLLNLDLYYKLVDKHKLNDDFLVRYLILQTLLALDQLQATAHFLHADLKPANVFIRFDFLLQQSPMQIFIREHEGMEISQFWAPHMGMQALLGDFGISAFELGPTLYHTSDTVEFGVTPLQQGQYIDFGINPYILPLPVSSPTQASTIPSSSSITQLRTEPSAQSTTQARHPLTVASANPQLIHAATNSYDLDTFILQCIVAFEETFPSISMLLNYIQDVESLPAGRYVGRYNQTRFPAHVCQGLDYDLDMEYCPLRASEQGVPFENNARPTRLSNHSIQSFLNSRAFQEFHNPNPAFEDPQWQHIITPKAKHSYLQRLVTSPSISI